jgi:hypothetical protein
MCVFRTVAVVAQPAKRTTVNRNAGVHRVRHGIFRSRTASKTALLVRKASFRSSCLVVIVFHKENEEKEGGRFSPVV